MLNLVVVVHFVFLLLANLFTIFFDYLLRLSCLFSSWLVVQIKLKYFFALINIKHVCNVLLLLSQQQSYQRHTVILVSVHLTLASYCQQSQRTLQKLFFNLAFQYFEMGLTVDYDAF